MVAWVVSVYIVAQAQHTPRWLTHVVCLAIERCRWQAAVGHQVDELARSQHDDGAADF